MEDKKFRALMVREQDGGFVRKIEERSISELPDHEVLIRVLFSGLNYKDALSATGNKGVTRTYPFQPGIDASGIVEASKSPLFNKGDEVLVTGYDLGMNTDGGFGEYIRVPGDWVVPRPSGLTLRECMIYGTAGFTVALGVDKMLRMGQKPEDGDILVTGASGGVGSIAVAVLSRLGFNVIAATGKQDAHDYLKSLGAKRIIDREEVDDTSGRLLLKPMWAGAYDTVGGNILNTVLRACKVHGSVATAGNALSFKLDTTVFPFILNGVNLLGVNSATCPMDHRRELWDKLAGKWRISHMDKIAQPMKPEELDHYIDEIIKGRIMGRMLLEY
ncbi:MAG: YhdH/YhfP family quinone oxidoreductase [Bacteroidetes bacterium]|nr:YhdH/YhfP family quinone oxidoreductase [Bacteroidota bacterium]